MLVQKSHEIKEWVIIRFNHIRLHLVEGSDAVSIGNGRGCDCSIRETWQQRALLAGRIDKRYPQELLYSVEDQAAVSAPTFERIFARPASFSYHSPCHISRSHSLVNLSNPKFRRREKGRDRKVYTKLVDKVAKDIIDGEARNKDIPTATMKEMQSIVQQVY
ncbi:hypothetical protein J6590_102916 [Homalodisca vitripennis]|nr:hypothetical protein J6590_102916 [Homalodisca vitripennis]